MVLIDSRPAGEAAGPLPASVATPERMLTPRMSLLFLVADTGGGHRSAARAVGEALEEAYPGWFDAVPSIRSAGRAPRGCSGGSRVSTVR